MTDNSLPIGVFDSGVGGLTVTSALRRRLPDESLLYLGDAARQPYGTKAPETVVRYALGAAAWLKERGIKLLVVACNTASAQTLPALRDAFPGLPLLGVVEPGAAAAVRASRSGRILVAATEGTCRSGSYERAIKRLRPDASVVCTPCPLFVAMAEEAMTEGRVVEMMAEEYLGAHLGPRADGGGCDTLVLGCTHFPLLRPALAKVAGPGVALVDCGEATADALAVMLAERGLAAPGNGGGGQAGRLTLVTTDAPRRFQRIAGMLFPDLGAEPPVELADL